MPDKDDIHNLFENMRKELYKHYNPNCDDNICFYRAMLSLEETKKHIILYNAQNVLP